METRRRSHSFCEADILGAASLEPLHQQMVAAGGESSDSQSRRRSRERSGDDVEAEDDCDIYGPPRPVFTDEDADEYDSTDEQPDTRGRTRSKSLYGMENSSLLPPGVSASTAMSRTTDEVPQDYTMESRTGALRSTEIKALEEGLKNACSARPESLAAEEEEERRLVSAERHHSFTAMPQLKRQGSPASRKIKLLMLGDSGVGKSSLINRWMDNTFVSNLVGTVGVDFKVKKLQISDQESVTVQVWDTAGQEKFHKITTAYYKGAHGILLVFDVCSESSLQGVTYWMSGIQGHASNKIQVVLIGNKVDMRGHPSTSANVPYDTGKATADRYGVSYFETSAKTGACVEEAFRTVALSVYRTVYSEGVKPVSESTTSTKRSHSVPNGFPPKHTRRRSDKCVVS